MAASDLLRVDDQLPAHALVVMARTAGHAGSVVARPHRGLPAGQQGVQAGAVAALDEQLRTEDLVHLGQGHGNGVADFHVGVGVDGGTSISC